MLELEKQMDDGTWEVCAFVEDDRGICHIPPGIYRPYRGNQVTFPAGLTLRPGYPVKPFPVISMAPRIKKRRQDNEPFWAKRW